MKNLLSEPEVIPKGKAKKEAEAREAGWAVPVYSYLHEFANTGWRSWLIQQNIIDYGVSINFIKTKDPFEEVKVGDTIEVNWKLLKFTDTATSVKIMRCV